MLPCHMVYVTYINNYLSKWLHVIKLNEMRKNYVEKTVLHVINTQNLLGKQSLTHHDASQVGLGIGHSLAQVRLSSA